MASRVYVAGRGTDLNARVAWMDPDTYVFTALPAIGVVGQLRSMAVIALDDIWVGWYWQNSASNYPKVAHWDGASWTVMEMAHLPPIYQQYAVVDFCVVSSNEIYALVSLNRVLKWDGISWSTHISTGGSPYISEYASILPGSTANDMWLGMLSLGINYVGHWNGSTFDEYTRLVADSTGDDTSGLITYKGEIYAACRDATAKVRTGVDTWATKFTVPYSFSPLYGGNCWWHDDVEDILWCGSRYFVGTQRSSLSKWDGTTVTHYNNTLNLTAYVDDLTGISVAGQDARLYYVGQAQGAIKIRESDGSWRNEADSGQYYAIQAYSDPFFVTSVAPDVISTIGGELMVATGVFPTTGTLQVHLGPLGSTSDPLCFGESNLGYTVVSRDGTTIQFYSPPLPKGPATLTVVGDAVQASFAGITVVERNWPEKLHRGRRNIQPWVGTGARLLKSEPEVP